MNAGDLVRLKCPDGLLRPWSGYAKNRVQMRVKRIQSGDGPGSARVKIVDPVSERQEWFDESELQTRAGETRRPSR